MELTCGGVGGAKPGSSALGSGLGRNSFRRKSPAEAQPGAITGGESGLGKRPPQRTAEPLVGTWALVSCLSPVSRQPCPSSGILQESWGPPTWPHPPVSSLCLCCGSSGSRGGTASAGASSRPDAVLSGPGQGRGDCSPGPLVRPRFHVLSPDVVCKQHRGFSDLSPHFLLV